MESKISELADILGDYLHWHKARLSCFSAMLIALFASRTICLYRLVVVMGGNAEQESRYKRVKRFFRQFTFDTDLIAHLIFSWFVSEGKKVYITFDRTNWFFGKAKINVFMLAIAYEGIAIPLFWNLLPKAGNASAKEHIALLARFIKVFGSTPVQGVLGDREFGSGELFSWCTQQKIPFYIRIKEGSQIKIKGKKWYSAEKLFKQIKPKEHELFAMAVEVFSQKVYLAGSRSESGELMIVATNQPTKEAIAIYLRRWEIENLFQCLKGRGFHFEETHMTALDRLEKLITLLAIGVCWAHKIGEWRAIRKPIPLNRYRDSHRPQCSYFRYGLDFIQSIIFLGSTQRKNWRNCLNCLDFGELYAFQEIDS